MFTWSSAKHLILFPAAFSYTTSKIEIVWVGCKMNRQLAMWSHSEVGNQQVLLRLATCHKWSSPGTDMVLHAIPYLHRLSGWWDWNHHHQVWCWYQTGWWGRHIRKKSHLTKRPGKGARVGYEWYEGRQSAKSCTWDDITSTDYTLHGWGAALLKGTCYPGGQAAELESAVQPWSNKGKSDPGLHR